MKTVPLTSTQTIRKHARPLRNIHVQPLRARRALHSRTTSQAHNPLPPPQREHLTNPPSRRQDPNRNLHQDLRLSAHDQLALST